MGKKLRMPCHGFNFFFRNGLCKLKNGRRNEEALKKDITRKGYCGRFLIFINKINPFVIKILGLTNKERLTHSSLQKRR